MVCGSYVWYVPSTSPEKGTLLFQHVQTSAIAHLDVSLIPIHWATVSPWMYVISHAPAAKAQTRWWMDVVESTCLPTNARRPLQDQWPLEVSLLLTISPTTIYSWPFSFFSFFSFIDPSWCDDACYCSLGCLSDQSDSIGNCKPLSSCSFDCTCHKGADERVHGRCGSFIPDCWPSALVSPKVLTKSSVVKWVQDFYSICLVYYRSHSFQLWMAGLGVYWPIPWPLESRQLPTVKFSDHDLSFVFEWNLVYIIDW